MHSKPWYKMSKAEWIKACQAVLEAAKTQRAESMQSMQKENK